MTSTAPAAARRTQAARRERSRGALLEAAARELSRHGYTNTNLERVAAEAGYTRGALYHQFSGKQDLALAVLAWIEETWWARMADVIDTGADPAQALRAVARAHAVFCRRDIARVAMTLRVEFSGQDHPVGRAVDAAVERVVGVCTDLVTAGRTSGVVPPGPDPRSVALAVIGAVEGLVISLAGRAPDDEVLADRAVVGLLGLDQEAHA